MRAVKWLFILPIEGYRLFLSPIIGPRCRHLPTCSEYAKLAIHKHGAWIGFWLMLSRIARCHPWGSHGYDPVPEKRPPQGWRFWRHGDWSWRERGPTPPPT